MTSGPACPSEDVVTCDSIEYTDALVSTTEGAPELDPQELLVSGQISIKLVLLLPSALCLFPFSVPTASPSFSLSRLFESLLSLLSVLLLSFAVFKHASSHLTLAPELDEFLDNPEHVDVGLSEDAPDPERERDRLVMRIPFAVSAERRLTVSVAACEVGMIKLPLLFEEVVAELGLRVAMLGRRIVEGRPRPRPSMLFFFFPTSVPMFSPSTPGLGRSHWEGEAVRPPASKEEVVSMDDATEDFLDRIVFLSLLLEEESLVLEALDFFDTVSFSFFETVLSLSFLSSPPSASPFAHPPSFAIERIERIALTAIDPPPPLLAFMFGCKREESGWIGTVAICTGTWLGGARRPFIVGVGVAERGGREAKGLCA